jgi:hypothetical protein
MSDRRSNLPPASGPRDSESKDALDTDSLDADALEPLLTQALASRGLLIPETPEEVFTHEREQGADLPLPVRLTSFEYRPSDTEARASNVVPLRERRDGREHSPQPHAASRAWPRYLLGFTLGAAASSVFWITTRPTDKPPLAVGGAGDELGAPPKPETLPTYTLSLNSSCENCCGGSACAAEKKEGSVASSCASGRPCISCNAGGEKNAFKLRISAVGFSPEGRQWAAGRGGPNNLQVCAEIQGKSLGCRSAVEEPGDLLDWSSLPVATTSGQLVGGLRVELRSAAGAAVTPPLATWASAVTVTPDTLCRGLSARLSADNVNVGRVSVFFDDPYYVELGRASTVSQLLTLKNRFRVTGDDLTKVYETTSAGDQNFALVFGPTDRSGSEKVRWQLLDQNLNAPIVLGTDFRGQPRPF